MQQKIVTQSDALEITMKFKASPIGESTASMNQIQVQLVNLMLQLQGIKKEKENREYLWYTRCHVYGHTKDTCPDFQKYMLFVAPIPLSCGSVS